MTDLLWLLILPYAYIGGFATAAVHHREVNPERCGDRTPPLCVLGGIFWPLVAVVAVVVICGWAGWYTASTPVRRKQRTEALRRADLRSIEGAKITRR